MDLSGAAAVPSLRFITRRGCHLCTEALATVRQVMAEALPGATWEIVDVDSDPELRDEYGWDVPVVLVDGTRVAKWRVDPAALRARLVRDMDRGP